MFLRSFFFGAAVLLAGVGITHANDDPAAAARTRKAVDRSLPFRKRKASRG